MEQRKKDKTNHIIFWILLRYRFQIIASFRQMTLRHSIDLLHILGGSGSAATKDECLVAVWMIPSCKYILLTEDRRAGLDISPWLHEGSRSFVAAVISREEKNKITCKCFIAHILVTKKKRVKEPNLHFYQLRCDDQTNPGSAFFPYRCKGWIISCLQRLHFILHFLSDAYKASKYPIWSRAQVRKAGDAQRHIHDSGGFMVLRTARHNRCRCQSYIKDYYPHGTKGDFEKLTPRTTVRSAGSDATRRSRAILVNARQLLVVYLWGKKKKKRIREP